MRKKSTRLLSAALAACMMLSVLPVGAIAAEPSTEPENAVAAQEEARKKAEAREKLPETVEALRAALADADALNLDQDYRLTLLELGVTDDETTA